ncbi:MAG TPA: tRNA (adenosine(37)-N6)-dimethylallyltransferase MiaA [Ignavibacteria bacterium]|nr:tRNA (adenosine(37)-N6)-dimethylallyltransferase MiaA [Ignavibacteria bacterium]
MKKVLAIVGPTASGKTKLSVDAAFKLNGEIISADSRQVYKYIPIATSHPDKEDLNKVRHYFINELELSEEFNAGEFGTKAREIIRDIFKRNKQPIITGGSGLYIRSVIDGLFEEEIEASEVREELYEKMNTLGKEYLYDELVKIDKKSADTMIPQNFRRVIRALEVYYVTGKRISDFQKEKIDVDFTAVQIGLMFDRKHLYRRINERVDRMLEEGLMEEAKNLRDRGFDHKKYYSLNTVGLKEIFKHIEGEYDFDEMVRLVKQNTRRYAKRQLTWFRKDKRINWVEVDEGTDDKYIIEKVLDIFKNS